MEDEKTQTKDSHFRLEQFLQKNKLSVLLAVFGVIVLGAGVLGIKLFSSKDSQIEILIQESQEGEEEETIFVDLAGAVQKPGVYELRVNSRINDLLTVAGGLSAEADREWVSQNLNLAQRLADGAKIYIPFAGASSNPPNPPNPPGILGLININTASSSQLETLWGIGPATAEKIISSRPYQSAEELRAKKIVKSNVWEAIKDKITVY